MHNELDCLYQLLQTDAYKSVLINHQLGRTVRVEYKNIIAGAMIETLAANVQLANGENAEAFNSYINALKSTHNTAR